MGHKENSEQKLANQNYHFPLRPTPFYFTCHNSEEGGRYIQKRKIILFFLVRPWKHSSLKFFKLFYFGLQGRALDNRMASPATKARAYYPLPVGHFLRKNGCAQRVRRWPRLVSREAETLINFYDTHSGCAPPWSKGMTQAGTQRTEALINFYRGWDFKIGLLTVLPHCLKRAGISEI